MKKTLVRVAVLLSLMVSMATAAGKIHEEVKIINKYGHVGLWNTFSGQTLGFGRLAFNVYGNHSSHEDFIKNIYTPDYQDSVTKIPDFSKSQFNVSLAYGFARFLDVAVMVPVYVDWVEGTQFANTESWPNGKENDAIGAAGDITVSAKFQYPPYPHRNFFKMSYYGALSLPTGNGMNGFFPRNTYYHNKRDLVGAQVNNYYTTGSGKVDVDMRMLWTWDFREVADNFPVLFHMNYGLKWTTNYYSEHTFNFNSGLEVRPADFISIFLDFSAEPRFGSIEQNSYNHPIDTLSIGDPGYSDTIDAQPKEIKRSMYNDPMRLSPGVAFLIPGGFNFTVGTDISIAHSYGRYTQQKIKTQGNAGPAHEVIMETAVEPKVSLAASIGWNGFVLPQDNDNDGIKDNVDNCPQDPEDFDGFNDGDGCPEWDNDNDGIADSVDQCMNEAEDMDGFEDEDGCPDLDNDGDGIVDLQDKCPNDPEDMDGFQDEDGCPDYDNDNDGIADSVDVCPDDAEDMDGFEDTDGCPDTDNDQDGILDAADKCPNEPETYNNFEDQDGCPDEKPVEVVEVTPTAKPITRDPIVLRGVTFHSGRAELTAGSYDILDPVLQSLIEWPEVKIEISGHTDSVGSESGNRRLSHNRAKAVMEYFVMQGIDASRMRAIGKGESQPVASNETADGRALNRRVEMKRID